MAMEAVGFQDNLQLMDLFLQNVDNHYELTLYHEYSRTKRKIQEIGDSYR